MKSAVKLLSETESTATVGGYGVVFGGADLEGETFTRDTDYMLDLVPAKPVFYDHSHNERVQHSIGTVKALDAREDGLWIEAELDKSRQYTEAVLKLVGEGVLGWSSGSVAHLTRRDGGVIKQWPIVEFSLTATPAEPRTVGVSRIKSLVEQHPELEALLEVAEDSHDADATPDDAQPGEPANPETIEGTTMTEEVKAQDNSEVLDAIKALGSSIGTIAERVEKLEAEPVNPIEPATPAVIMDTKHWRYDNVDNGDLAFMIETLKEAERSGRSRYGVDPAAYKALAMRLESDEAGRDANMAEARKSMKMAGVKANEINQSTLSNYGDEWVGVAYSGALWESIRHATFVLNKLPQIEVPAGAESVVVPLESTDPTWYKVAQAASLSSNPGGIPTNTVTASNLGTDNKTLTLGKMGARVLWTGEMEEDAVLPYVAQLRAQLAVSGAEYLEHVLIDGDTATGGTTNINDIAGTPAGTEAFLILNGFRKSPLVTTTANSRDGGTLAVEDYLQTVQLMGASGRNALDRNKVSFIIDPATYYKTLQLTEVKTQDVFSSPTIENGMLTRLWGYEVINSAHMAKLTNGLTNSAGKSDLDTSGNNTKGQILAVRWDQWMFGWRRRMTIETQRIAAADSTEIVALMRFGMIQRDTEAAAISYNLTV